MIAHNLVSANGVNSSGIVIEGSTDVMVQANSARGFVQGIAVGTDAGKCDRVQVGGNAVDVSGLPASATAVRVGTRVGRVVVVDNTVSGSSSAAACVDLQGPTSGTRLTRDNICW